MKLRSCRVRWTYLFFTNNGSKRPSYLPRRRIFMTEIKGYQLWCIRSCDVGCTPCTNIDLSKNSNIMHCFILSHIKISFYTSINITKMFHSLSQCRLKLRSQSYKVLFFSIWFTMCRGWHFPSCIWWKFKSLINVYISRFCV